MRLTRISRDPLPDHDGDPIIVTTPQGDEIGRLEFNKNTSKWTDLWDLPPHRPMTLKRKHRRN